MGAGDIPILVGGMFIMQVLMVGFVRRFIMMLPGGRLPEPIGRMNVMVGMVLYKALIRILINGIWRESKDGEEFLESIISLRAIAMCNIPHF
jgi:hypothetical protein